MQCLAKVWFEVEPLVKGLTLVVQLVLQVVRWVGVLESLFQVDWNEVLLEDLTHLRKECT